jgi:hypothetical protein
MARIKKIQCPSCGSNSTYKLFNGDYKCNYCDSNFLVNESPYVDDNSANYSKDIFSGSSKKTPLVGYAVIAGFIVFFGIGMISFFLFRSSNSSIQLDVNELVEPTVKLTQAFIGNKGTVIWVITESHELKDSVRYDLLIIDPLTKSTKTKKLITSLAWNSSTDFNKKINSVFWQYGNFAYNISDDNGFVAYDIYTGNVEITSAILVKAHEELKGGILKIEHAPLNNGFVITTTMGDVFRFDPYSKTINSKLSSETGLEKVTSQLYLSGGLKHQLYIFTKKGSGFPILSNNFIEESYTKDQMKSNGYNVKDIFGNINLEKVSDKPYFRAHPLLTDKSGNLLIMFNPDLTENSPVILESVNMKGESNWTLQDSLLLKTQKAFGSENLESNFIYSDLELIIVLPTKEHHYLGIDIKTGKKIWDFNVKQYVSNTSNLQK